LDDRGGGGVSSASGTGASDLVMIREQSPIDYAVRPVMATAAALTIAGRGATSADVSLADRDEHWQPIGTSHSGRPEGPLGPSYSGRAGAAAQKASRGYSVIPEARHAAYLVPIMRFLVYRFIITIYCS